MSATVLIVDDSLNIRRSLGKSLEQAGYRVFKASNGRKALAVVRHERPDVIISDIALPGMDGFELIRRLRANPISRHTKVVLYTSMYPESQIRDLANLCGVFHVVSKSSPPALVVEAVRSLLETPSITSVMPAFYKFHEMHARVIGNKINEQLKAIDLLNLRFEAMTSLGRQLVMVKSRRRLLRIFRDKAMEIIPSQFVEFGLLKTLDDETPKFLLDVMRQHQPIRLGSAARTEMKQFFRSAGKECSTESLMVVPVTTASNIYGWLCFAAKEDHKEFDEDEERTATSLGSQLALALENRSRLHHIKRHARDLERGMDERIAELYRSNSALEGFAYTAAHDLLAPLHTAIGYLERLKQQQADHLETESQQSLEVIMVSIARMEQLICGVLTYSRLGGSSHEFNSIDGNIPLKQAVDNLSADIAKAEACVTNDPMPKMHGDLIQLTQLFQNLIQNAITYHSAAKPSVHITVKSLGTKWQISVVDNGIGIQPTDIGRIFKPFERLHARGNYPGNGIGLAICKRIVEDHGGQIWIEPGPSQGSSFCFTLPCLPEVASRLAI